MAGKGGQHGLHDHEKSSGGKRHLILPLPTNSQRDKPMQASRKKPLVQKPIKANCVSQGGLEAEGALGQVPSHPSLTLDVLGVVNDKVPVPDHRQVDGQVTDVIPFIEILQEETEGAEPVNY